MKVLPPGLFCQMCRKSKQMPGLQPNEETGKHVSSLLPWRQESQVWDKEQRSRVVWGLGRKERWSGKGVIIVPCRHSKATGLCTEKVIKLTITRVRTTSLVKKFMLKTITPDCQWHWYWTLLIIFLSGKISNLLPIMPRFSKRECDKRTPRKYKLCVISNSVTCTDDDFVSETKCFRSMS